MFATHDEPASVDGVGGSIVASKKSDVGAEVKQVRGYDSADPAAANDEESRRRFGGR